MSSLATGDASLPTISNAIESLHSLRDARVPVGAWTPATRFANAPVAIARDFRHDPVMPAHVLIDGNNLLHAMHAQAIGRHIGRETLVRWIERWAEKRSDEITLVFDGPAPNTSLLRQMDSARITVRFAAPKSADDILVEMIQATKTPTAVRLVSGDTAIQYEARFRKCPVTSSLDFSEELLAAQRQPPVPRARES